MQQLFVTATGTEIGKTLVTTLLVRALRAADRTVAALKPVATGFDSAEIELSDTGRLLEALDLAPSAANIDRLTPWRYRDPLSPDMAAAREARPIDFDALVAYCRRAVTAETTLIEGIGGVMTPLDAEHTVLDWIAALGAPALLVAGSYLGTLSHTLTALGMLRTRQVPVTGIVVSESPQQPVPPEETLATLTRFAPGVPLVLLPRAAEPATAPELATLLERTPA